MCKPIPPHTHEGVYYLKYREYSDEQFIEAVKNNKSIFGVLKELKLRPVGGNYMTVHRNVAKFNCNTDHWTNQGWSKNMKLKDWSSYKRPDRIKVHLIKERGHQCENCNNTDWMDKQIILELDHIDGDRTNNDPSNLRLLCPNCHSQTPTWRRRKKA